MYARIKRLYDTGKLTKDGVRNAVIKGWITAEQYEEITGEAYDEDLQDFVAQYASGRRIHVAQSEAHRSVVHLGEDFFAGDGHEVDAAYLVVFRALSAPGDVVVDDGGCGIEQCAVDEGLAGVVLHLDDDARAVAALAVDVEVEAVHTLWVGELDFGVDVLEVLDRRALDDFVEEADEESFVHFVGEEPLEAPVGNGVDEGLVFAEFKSLHSFLHNLID